MNAHKKAFFEKMEQDFVALTYDDVRLRTSRSEYSPSEVDVSSKFSRNIDLKVPIVSSPMDTVTESDMAISMAKLGGLGIIHAGLSIEDQIVELQRVKFHHNGLIEAPRKLRAGQTITEALNYCEEKRFDFRTFPVIDNDRKFIGLVTGNDFDHSMDLSQPVESIMTPLSEVTKAKPGTDIEEAYKMLSENKKKILPLINEDGTVAGMYVWSDVRRIIEDNSGLYNVDSKGQLRVGAAIPTSEGGLERLKEIRPFIDVVVFDSADGDSKYMFMYLPKARGEYPDLDIVAGNITERDSARELALEGADGIRTGQGPSAICTTRPEIGIGCPQVTAIYETVQGVEDAATLGDKYRIPICADGGINNKGDIPIAIAAGAHSVMIGTGFAGTDESPGEIIEEQGGRKVKIHRGMGSLAAFKDSAASKERYGGNMDDDELPLAEGIETKVPYRGSAAKVMKDYTKALRKSYSYCGSGNTEDHRQNTRFWRMTGNGLKESGTRV